MDEDADENNGLPCEEKLAFDTKKDAEATANVAHYRYGNKLKAYVCRYCNLWHLSSNPGDDD